jgi:hypothetical protein
MDVELLRQDVRGGRIHAERLVDVIESMQQQFETVTKQLEAARQRIAELEKKNDPPAAKLDQPYSMRSEQQRQESRTQKKRKRKGGRLKNKHKIALAERFEPVYPEGNEPSDCYLSHERPVWRLEQGRAVHLVYIVGLSFDKVCQVLHFLQDLKLTKSQADASLYQLSRHWSANLKCYGRCWQIRWWCMRTRRVGASTASGPFCRRSRGCCCSASTRMPRRSGRFSIRQVSRASC